MASSISNFVNNLSEGINRINGRYGHDDKKCEIYGIKYCGKYWDYFFWILKF